ncbi:hypothetical protein ACSMXN_21795 [Jatrophihabitans sp. DSM 45814]
MWLTAEGIYSWLSATEQWQLHAYYQPSNNLSQPELIEHRQLITLDRPSLPQQAGRALAKLEAQLAEGDPPPRVLSAKRRWAHTERRITVTSVVHPEPDAERLAKVLLEIFREQQP